MNALIGKQLNGHDWQEEDAEAEDEAEDEAEEEEAEEAEEEEAEEQEEQEEEEAEEQEQEEKEEAEEQEKIPTIATISHPLVKETLESLAQTATFGIYRYVNGPFIQLNDLVLEGNKLYCTNNGIKSPVSRILAKARRTTRARWIHNLWFIQDGEPKLFKEYLSETHNLTFS
jgi:flagellar biosynthesis GTPase FlhF